MSSSTSTWTLKGISGEFEGNTLPLRLPVMTLGRTQQNHIIVPDVNISRLHATFFQENNGLDIQDEKSRNGVQVNEIKLEAGQRVALKHGDRLQIGVHGFTVEVTEASQSKMPQSAPTKNSTSAPQPQKTRQLFQATSLIPGLVEKLKNLSPLQIQWNRRKIMYSVLGAFLLMMLLTQIPTNSGKKTKKTTSPIADIEIKTGAAPDSKTSAMDDRQLDTLKSQAKAALQFQDYLAATELYEKIARSEPQDDYVKTQYEFAKKKLKQLIEKHLEFAKREYEKLNYESAIIEWKQVMALTLRANPEVYEQTEQKIRDAEKEMMKKR